jgi:arylsulfatase A-like enzyme
MMGIGTDMHDTNLFLKMLFIVPLVLPAIALAEQPGERPNVLFLSVDDMNDWIGCLGSTRVPTPNIDALARRGLLFTNAHAPSPKCAPSRAAILTGKRASTTGLYGNGHWWRPNYPDIVTLPQYFKQHGYHVAGGGKIHHHTPGFNPPDQWHEYFDLIEDKNLIKGYLEKRGDSKRFLTDMPRHPRGSLDWGPINVTDMEMGDGHTIKWASDFLAKNHDKPFFLAVGLFQPHLPFYAPQKYFDGLPLEKVILPNNKSDDLDDVPAGGKALAKYRRNDLRMIEEHGGLKHCVQSYLCSIAHADALIGKLFDAFDKSDYRDNTIIVFWSDHGYHFGEKDHFAKNTLWGRSTHVPFICVVPGLTKAGTRCDRTVDLTCLYPTLTQLCGLPVPDGLDGADIAPLLRNPESDWRHPAIIDFLMGNTAVRTQHWCYIQYDQGRMGEELYDLHKDPNEWNNLISKQQGVAKTLKRLLPHSYADPQSEKSDFRFDSHSYKWTRKAKETR